jgi:hypothetical protein
MKFCRIGVLTSFGILWASDKEIAAAGLRWGGRKKTKLYPRKNNEILSDFCELVARDLNEPRA